MSSAALYPSFGSNAALFINVLVTIVTVGQILLAALFLTLAVSKSITKRNPTLLNVILVSFLTGIPPVLLYVDRLVNLDDSSKTPPGFIRETFSIQHRRGTCV
jgi:hypothetical protein